MRKLVCITTLCFMIIAMFSGCALLQKLGFQKDSDELTPVSSITMGEADAKKLIDKVPIRLYFGNEDNTKLKLEVRYIDASEADKSVNNLATVIANELIKGPSKGTGLKPTIPDGAKLVTRVKIDGTVATVNFSKEFVDNHPGGKDAERLTIYSVVNSLTEVKEIQKVKFLINGEKRSSFKGNFQFDVPFPRTMTLLSKETTPANSDKAEDSKGNKSQGAVGKNDASDNGTAKDSGNSTIDSGNEDMGTSGSTDGDYDENGEILE